MKNLRGWLSNLSSTVIREMSKMSCKKYLRGSENEASAMPKISPSDKKKCKGGGGVPLHSFATGFLVPSYAVGSRPI